MAAALLTPLSVSTLLLPQEAPRTQVAGPWGCAVVEQLDKSVCLWDPLPERLPIPSVPRVTPPTPPGP